jgi:Ca2+/Na+ antiporter
VNGSNFMQGWVALTGSIAMIALILTALGLMLCIVKPADALRRVAAILGIVMLLMVLPAVLVNVWTAMSLWQRLTLAAIVICVWRWRRPRRKAPNQRGR